MMKNTLKYISILCLSVLAWPLAAQAPVPAPAQSQPIAIVGATAHLGTGQAIENSLIAFENGKITVVAPFSGQDISKYKVIQAQGKHVYPGFIAPDTNLGLIEIGQTPATQDYAEIGDINPNVRALIAYNTDSQVTPTVRGMGVLIAQIVPSSGVLSGQSSVVQLDAWNWEDAAYLADDGVHVSFPNRQRFSFATFGLDDNPQYDEQIKSLKDFLSDAKSYCGNKSAGKEINLKLEAMCGLFDGSKRFFVHANSAQDMTQAILMAKEYGMKLVIVGGADAWMMTEQLKTNNVAVILGSTQALPGRIDDDVDLPFKAPRLLHEAGVTYCLGHEGYWQYRNLSFQAGQAVGFGLPYEEAVAAITLNTAKILGIADRAGSLEVGKDAILFVSDGDALDSRSDMVTHAFIQGREIDLNNKQKVLYEKFKEKYARMKK